MGKSADDSFIWFKKGKNYFWGAKWCKKLGWKGFSTAASKVSDPVGGGMKQRTRGDSKFTGGLSSKKSFMKQQKPKR